jgi:hypothetical protein
MTNEKEMNRTVPVNDEILADETLARFVTRSPCALPSSGSAHKLRRGLCAAHNEAILCQKVYLLA